MFENDSIVMRNAQIITKNFTGTAKNIYDTEGKRYILIRLDPDDAENLRADGWPVKVTKPNPEKPDYEPYPYIKVNLKDKFYFHGLRKTSRVYMVTKKNKILLEPNDFYQLEENYIEKADLKIDHVYYKSYDQWSVVLESGFFTIEPDELYDEYFGESTGPVIDDEDNPFM